MLFKRVCDPFDVYMNKMFKGKCEATKGTASYMIRKILMNSLYGKMIQKPIISDINICRNYDDLKRIRERAIITDMFFMSDNVLCVHLDWLVPYQHPQQF